MRTDATDVATVDLVGPVSLDGADGHGYAASRLREELVDLDWTAVPISMGHSVSDQIQLRTDPDMPEGAYDVNVARRNGRAAIEVIGGPVSGVIQGVEALLRSRPDTRQATIPIGVSERSPALALRVLWTWDHSTHWDVDTVGLQETGAFNPYMKQPEEFVSDYRRVIDFMSRLGLGGLVIYGLLRDSHGGVDAANELCRYARERGVRILAGVAINSYGGIYYEGQHAFNLATWLRRHPELAEDTATLPGFQIGDYGYLPFPRGEYTMASRSDSAAMERWHLDGIDWLLDNVEVDGINFEFGDYAGNDALADMRRLLPGLIAHARAHRDHLWLIAELEWDSIVEDATAEHVRGLPEGCAYQFTYNKSYWPRLRSKLDRATVSRLPLKLSMVRPHSGSQWNRQRYAHMAPDFAEMAQIAIAAGLAGASVFGEVSDYSPPNELSLLAFARFARERGLTWDAFFLEEVQPRLGGSDVADRYIALLNRLDANDLDDSDLLAARDEVRAVAVSLVDPARRRWGWLEERLSRRIHSRIGT